MSSGQACLLEINPRHSQSHAELFELVDGSANHQVMLQLGLGRRPDRRRRKGERLIAAQCIHRSFGGDAVVTRVPTPEEIRRIEDDVPGTRIRLGPEAGQRLSDLPGQDSYSFELAEIVVGAQTEESIERKFRACVGALQFEFDRM